MTVAALALTPLALFTLRYAGRGVQSAMRRVMNADRAMVAELEQTVSGISEIQMFNAQPLRSRRFRDVSETSAKSTATSVMWMQATANGSQVFLRQVRSWCYLSASGSVRASG
jgi:ABC-type multidrug transport system fused ATPase/permease subunit